MARDVDKGPDAFRTISEVAEDLDLPQHVLRFWEGRFPQIKPLKRGGGRRYYRPDDVDLLKGIRHLLYGEGYTIRGVQRILKEQGVRVVMSVWQEGAPRPPAPGRADDPGEDLSYDESFGFDDGFAAEPETGSGHPGDEPGFGGGYGDEAGPSVASIAQRFAPRLADRPGTPQRPGQYPSQRAVEESVTARAPQAPRPDYGSGGPVRGGLVERGERLPAGVAPDDDDTVEEGRSAFGALIDRLRPGHPVRPDADPATPPRLSRDDVRHLQATLFELLECKRLLDQAR